MSLMPVGVGAEVIVAPAAGALGGGKFCNINSSGFIRLASNAAVSTNANGFVLVGYADGATATMYGISNTNTALAGLATGTQYFLGTAGGVLATSPTTPTGTIVQPLGRAHAVDSLIFSNSEFFFVKTLPA